MSQKLRSIITLKRKEINFFELAKAMSYFHPETEKHLKDFRCQDKELQHQTLSHVKGDTYMWDYNSYIKSLKIWIAEQELENHIILHTNTEPKIIDKLSPMHPWQQHELYFTKCTITIQNAIIIAHTGHYDFYMDAIPTEEAFPSDSKKFSNRYNGGLHVVFQNNCFKKSINSLGISEYVHFWMGQNSFLEFKHNSFCKVSLFVSPLHMGSYSLLTMENNAFNNLHTTIAVTSRGMAYNSGGWTLNPEIVGKIQGKIQLETFINSKIPEANKIKLDFNDIRCPISQSIIKIKNNKFSKLTILGQSKLFFQGTNIIDIFNCNVDYVHFDSPQKIDPKGKAVFRNKQMFTKLVKQAVLNEDVIQEEIFRKNVEKLSMQELNIKYKLYLWARNNTTIVWGVLVASSAIAAAISSVYIAFLE